MAYFFQQLLNGFHSSALYALLAFGYTLIHGVTHRTNIAHGALFAFSGQVMILAAVFGWQALWLTLPATLAFGAAVALALAALASHLLAGRVFKPLALRAPNTMVAATLGVAIVLMELARLSADTRDFWLPPILSTPVLFADLGGYRVTLTVIQLIDIAFAALAIAIGAALLVRTRLGRAWRAVADDPFAAATCGIDLDSAFTATVVAGGSMAALAGILAALYFGNVSWETGLIFGLKILFVTAVGGYRSPLSSAAGAALFGISEALWSGYFPLLWRDAWMFVFLVALLALRPDDEVEIRPARAL